MMDMLRGTILIVEDEATSAELLGAVLGSEHEIVFATTGQGALEMAEAVRPDVVLLDIMMPDIDGYEVCARLKEDRDTADSAVIFITALGDTEAELRGLSMGAVDYVTKPINPSTLLARVRNHVELKRSRDQLKLLNAATPEA